VKKVKGCCIRKYMLNIDSIKKRKMRREREQTVKEKEEIEK